MATAVDSYSPADAAPHVLPFAAAGEAGVSEFSCNACGEAFGAAIEQRAHCKTERHVYNTKRRLAGLKPISLEAWERKLRESRGAAAAGPSKGTAHLKAGKAPRKAGGDAVVDGAGGTAEAQGAAAAAAAEEATPEEPAAASPEAPGAVREDEGPFTPRRSLFDRQKFEDVEECLSYMWKTYNFSVADREYCTDLPGLLGALWRKVAEPPHACLFCNRKFQDAAAARRHMLDKSHTRMGTEARTRRGNTDEAGSEELRAELEDFYDFHSSTREVTERIRDPAEKVACLLRFFDADRDGRLRRAELGELWAAAAAAGAAAEGPAVALSGAAGSLSEAMYAGACARAGVAPEEGLDAEALGRLYAEGLADLDTHFAMLQDVLAKKLSTRTKERAQERLDEVDEEDEEEDGDEEGEGEGSEDGEDAEDGDGTSDGTEVLECDDEDEFEEVMRVLGLQQMTILDNGDLRLPNGAVAAHRDVAHIWRQRGLRQQGALALPGGPGGARGPGKPLRPYMLSIRAGTGIQRVALSRREQAREGKHVIAVLRMKHHGEVKIGIKKNNMQRKGKPVRTGFGDASGGR